MKCITAITTLVLLVPARGFTPSSQRSVRTQLFAEGDVILYSDEDETEKKLSGNKRWGSLSPAVKARIVQEGQQRAVKNKKKREPAADKKMRMMMHYKKAMVEAKKQSRIQRPFATNSPERIPLADMVIGNSYNGTVISLTAFGAYVDIGSECDGLLHVSQISRSQFVEHPRQVLSAGDIIAVTLVKSSPDLKKMQVSMLSQEALAEEDEDEEEFEERIPLDDLATDDELWGEIKRVTSFGAYVELGVVVQGWLHFMDHPEFDYGKEPSEFMKVGDRIRCWVANVDEERDRLKLTGQRPKDLPGPRREMRRMTDSEY
jgi:transcriptional accessory protein Tex/SPT6